MLNFDVLLFAAEKLLGRFTSRKKFPKLLQEKIAKNDQNFNSAEIHKIFIPSYLRNGLSTVILAVFIGRFETLFQESVEFSSFRKNGRKMVRFSIKIFKG